MLYRAALALLLALLASGCAGGPRFAGNTQTHKSCVADRWGWCDFTRAAAVRSYQYAQMANNAYAGRDDKVPFVLAGDLINRFMSPQKNVGFSYAIYDRMRDGQVTETIIAYRGTDALQDWFSGNFSGRQNREGKAVYEAARRALDESGNRDVPITVTGHSLGGGIASSVSQGRPEVSAFVFNSSPNFEPQFEANRPLRQAVVEKGEFLSLFRALKRSGNQRQNTINCRKAQSPFSFIDDHSIRLLADCLTWIAMRNGDKGAVASLAANPAIVPPDTERQPEEQEQERATEQASPDAEQPQPPAATGDPSGT